MKFVSGDIKRCIMFTSFYLHLSAANVAASIPLSPLSQVTGNFYRNILTNDVTALLFTAPCELFKCSQTTKRVAQHIPETRKHSRECLALIFNHELSSCQVDSAYPKLLFIFCVLCWFRTNCIMYNGRNQWRLLTSTLFTIQTAHSR